MHVEKYSEDVHAARLANASGVNVPRDCVTKASEAQLAEISPGVAVGHCVVCASAGARRAHHSNATKANHFIA